MKRLITLICIFSSTQLTAQTGIGTTTPHASAKLEISSNNKGFLPPRITLTGTNDITTIASPATGLVIYNTATSGTTPNNVIPGFYYYDGLKWNQLVDQSSLNSFSGFNPNYAQSNASAVTKSSVGDIVVSQSITTSGRPVQVIATGDANPANSGAWVQLQLFRDGTAIGKKVQAESSLNNENIPYCLNFIDNPTTPGTYTYSVRIVGGGTGGFGFGESDGNHITLLELGAWSAGTMPVSKGGTGNSSYTSGSVIFSDGTNLAQNNANFFWDNTNGRLGIGTNAPTSKLNIAGGGIKLASGLGNSSTRPSLNTSSIGNYEIRGVGGSPSQVDWQDDGFLRLSAGGGTDINTQSSIDMSGYSTVGDMNNNIVMRTGGTERLRINNTGNVGIGNSSPSEKLEVNGSVKATNFIGTASSATLYLLEAYASVSYTLPGTYTYDICRYSVVNTNINVSSSWFNTSTYRFTPQKAGYWEIIASYDIFRNSGESSLSIQKNGSSVAVNGTITSVVQQVTKIVYLNGSTDYITIGNTGSNSYARSQNSLSSWFQARWVGE